MDADAVFRAAGLDRSTFTEKAPDFVAAGAADDLHSWTGPHPKIPGLDLAINMATWKGRLTTFQVNEKWKDDKPETGSVAGEVYGIVMLLFAAAGVLTAILLARRNWRWDGWIARAPCGSARRASCWPCWSGSERSTRCPVRT